MTTMKPGEKVRFSRPDPDAARWGGNDDPADLLVVDNVYTVKSVNVRTWHTKIVLADFPQHVFNSVHFDPVGE